MSAPTAAQTAERLEGVAVREVVGALRRRWRFVAAGAVLGAGCGLGLSAATPVSYTAVAVVALNAVEADAAGDARSQGVSTATEGQVLLSSSVAQDAAEAIGWGGSTADLLEQVAVTSPRDSRILQVSFTADEPAAASAGADAFAAAYLGYRTELAQTQLDDLSGRLQDQIDQLSPQVAADASVAALVQDLRQQVSRLSTTRTDAGALVGAAQAPQSPSSLPAVVRVAMGLAIGLLLGAVAALVRDRRDRRIEGARDVAAVLGLPVLADLAADDEDGWRTVVAKLGTSGAGASGGLLVVVGDAAAVATDAARHLAEASAAAGAPAVVRPVDGVGALGVGALGDDGPAAAALAELPPGGRVLVDAVGATRRSSVLEMAGLADAVLLVIAPGVSRSDAVAALVADLADVGALPSAAVLVSAPRRPRAGLRGTARRGPAPRGSAPGSVADADADLTTGSPEALASQPGGQVGPALRGRA